MDLFFFLNVVLEGENQCALRKRKERRCFIIYLQHPYFPQISMHGSDLGYA